MSLQATGLQVSLHLQELQGRDDAEDGCNIVVLLG